MHRRKTDETRKGINRRDFVRLSTAGVTALGFGLGSAAAESAVQNAHHGKPELSLYSDLLQTWCDGLLRHQITTIQDPALHGGLLCPACAMIHGRCGDAVYPLLRVAHTTGDSKYMRAAVLVHDWSERQVSRPDGSWVNDVILSSWKGITVFHAIALGEALHHHGALLDGPTRQQWTERLARAAKFLDGFITIETGNVNYPVTASYCFALCGEVLGDAHYTKRAQSLAHTAMEYFTPNGILFGEGHPLNDVSPKGCRPVDLGYNVEESLPALALYSTLTNDHAVMAKVITALRTHMEFMLPDGSWDNSWGSRNYKWSWWGSRTSDGAQPAYVLLSQHQANFLEVARRNTQLMADCTHDGLLYGGPDYYAHGDSPCIHHTFTHAKALATVLDRGAANLSSSERYSLPRDSSYGLKSFPEIGTHLAAVGEWRATVTENDWEYVEKVQTGTGGGGGGHATGGALSILYHRKLGPILVASMTEYQIIETSNQQTFRDAPHMTLTPRIECSGTHTVTSLNDLAAVLTATTTSDGVTFTASGRLLTTAHQPLPAGEAHYRLTYKLSEGKVEITALVQSDASLPASLNFILPVVSREGEAVTTDTAGRIRIAKPGGTLAIRTDAPGGFTPLQKERTFNLVPGFECVPIIIALKPGNEIRMSVEAL